MVGGPCLGGVDTGGEKEEGLFNDDGWLGYGRSLYSAWRRPSVLFLRFCFRCLQEWEMGGGMVYGIDFICIHIGLSIRSCFRFVLYSPLA